MVWMTTELHLHNLTSWSYQWNLHFNESKCALLRLTPKSVDPSYNPTYFINNYPIATKESHKDLGVLISKDLSWEDHYDYMLSKACKTFGLLHRPLAKALSIHTKKVLYISLVQSKLKFLLFSYLATTAFERYAITRDSPKMSN